MKKRIFTPHRTMRRLITAILAICCIGTAASQSVESQGYDQALVDELRVQYAQSTNAKDRIKATLKLAFYFYQYAGLYDEASQYATEALRMIEAEDDGGEYAGEHSLCHRIIGRACYERKDYTKAVEHLSTAEYWLDENQELHRYAYGELLCMMGVSYWYLQDLYSAENYMLRADRIITDQQIDLAGSEGEQVESLNRMHDITYTVLGDISYRNADNSTAEYYLEDVAYSSNDTTLTGIAMLNLADIKGLKGDYVKAVEYAERAKPYLNLLRDASDILYVQYGVNFAAYYSSLGKREEAEELYRSMIAVCEGVDQPTFEHKAFVSYVLGSSYMGLNDLQSALKYFEQAYDIYYRAGEEVEIDIVTLSWIASQICRIHYSLENYAACIEYGKLTDEWIEEYDLEISSGIPEMFLAISYAYSEQDDTENGYAYLLKAYDSCKEFYGTSHEIYVESLFMLCNYHIDAGDKERAASLWQQLYKTICSITFNRFATMTTSEREFLWEEYMSNIMTFSASNYIPNLSDNKVALHTTYNSLLFSKGLLLAYNVELDRYIRNHGGKQLVELQEQTKQYQAELNQLAMKPHTEDTLRQKKSLEEQIEANEKQIAEQTAFHNYQMRINSLDVQMALGEGDVAVEFMEATEATDEPYYAALVLRRDWEAPQYVYIGSSSEIEQIFHNGHKIYSGRLSEQLHRMVWGALEPYINEGDNIYFAPAGVLHQINIEVLTDTEGRRANERYNPVRLSSTRELCLPREQKPQSEAVLYGDLKYDISAESMLFASRRTRGEGNHIARRGFNPSPHLRDKIAELPATADELRDIASTLGERGITTRLFTRGEGNEESFKALSGSSPQILHIATHGFFFHDKEAQQLPFYRTQGFDSHTDTSSSPLRRSGLILSGGERAWLGEELPTEVEDGILLSEEIATMDLGNVELVVLSACDTGLGEISSEGVFGLQRAFKMAGVKSIMMSLWKVEDRATALFMQTFYREWKGGATKREAFAEAQRRVREEYNPSPEYWAAFILLD